MQAGRLMFAALGPLVSGRVYPAPRPKSAPDQRPYITYQVISRVPVNTLDGYTGLERARVQIDIHDDTLTEVSELMQRVKWTLHHWPVGAAVIDRSFEQFEGESQLWRGSVDVFVSEG